ncbi:unnamed protein product, partial [Ectocarpus sp. 12 AP-2014]
MAPASASSPSQFLPLLFSVVRAAATRNIPCCHGSYYGGGSTPSTTTDCPLGRDGRAHGLSDDGHELAAPPFIRPQPPPPRPHPHESSIRQLAPYLTRPADSELHRPPPLSVSEQVTDRRRDRGRHDRRLRHRLHFCLHHLHRHRLLRFPGKTAKGGWPGGSTP